MRQPPVAIELRATPPVPPALPAPLDPEASAVALAGARSALLEERRLLTREELAALAVLPDGELDALAALAHEVRLDRAGATVEIEGILSAKTGGCPEDCHFCSQSAHFPTPVRPAPFLDTEEVLAAARETAALGASEFCLVLALRGPDERTMRRLEELVPLVAERTGVRVAVSAGILSAEQAARLAAAGVHRYNHNLETAASHFPAVVTTHSYAERYATCEAVLAAGMELCCGALLGLGESDAQRIELLEDLQRLSPGEVPVNFLNPRPGTPFSERPLLGAREAIRWIALFRLALPDAILRYGGGRELTLGELQAAGLSAGINGLIVGNYLTTLGRAPEEDLAMLAALEMPIGALGDVL
ncbi:MAG TPA: biotin synthase BioB [Acidimicrobiales bacterium]|nr:biotin synthase BioB [Acidimicrobiales bacterium]